MQKRIAALTMVRDGGHFLARWVDYYGGLLGKDNLYVFFDGQDQVPPECTAGCRVTVVPRVEGGVAASDRGRAAILSDCACRLLDRYDFVVGTDVDEFIVPDPSTGLTLPQYLCLLDTGGRRSFSPLGLDVVQKIDAEDGLDASKGLLEQRSYGLISTRYTKSSILCGKVEWGSGFHRARGCNLHILKDLYLFHFGCADASGVLSKIADGDLASRGWSRHLQKRRRLFSTVAKLPVRSWESWMPCARRLQTVIRPPYAWNKPAMLGLKILVRIPERFSKIF
ncbi:MAG: glycosyltransferase family 92 protein [Bacteroidales bacterium]|nr:glycosyltransferase family 92 protein [Bacteroidales bacterium]